MSEPVRSYHRVFDMETRMSTFGRDRHNNPIPLPRQVTVRRLVAFVVLVMLMLFVTAVLPLAFLRDGAGPVTLVTYFVVPWAGSWVLTAARPDGRRLHVSVLSWVLGWRTPRTLAGAWLDVGEEGATHRPPRVAWRRRPL